MKKSILFIPILLLLYAGNAEAQSMQAEKSVLPNLPPSFYTTPCTGLEIDEAVVFRFSTIYQHEVEESFQSRYHSDTIEQV